MIDPALPPPPPCGVHCCIVELYFDNLAATLIAFLHTSRRVECGRLLHHDYC